jgi:hypothetical protein
VPAPDPAAHHRGDPLADPDEIDRLLRSSTVALTAVPGVMGVTLGGSRARGTADAAADVDLGVYYDGASLDLAALAAAADAASDHPVALAVPGEWGPWVNGGAWLHVDGVAVDWILRDIYRVDAVWADCRAGLVRNEMQTGHPLGFWSHAYCGEVALARVLVDPGDALRPRRDEYHHYPDALAAALVRRTWEARFTLDIAAKAVRHGDVVYVAGCLFRAIGLMCHALHGHARSWVTNEKGLVALTTALPNAPDRFGERAATALASLAGDATALDAALTVASELLVDVENALRPADPDDRPA